MMPNRSRLARTSPVRETVRNRLACLAALALTSIIASGCATTLGQDMNLLSTEEEIEIGGQLASEVETQEKVHEDPELQAYVRMIGERLARVAPRQDVPYQFTVIDDPETVVLANAACNRLGLDVISTGVVAAFAIEAFEKGYLKGRDLHGLEPAWGSREYLLGVIDLLSLIHI